MELKIGRIDSPEGAALAAAHLAEMEVRYGEPDEWDGLDPDQLVPPHGTFLVAWLDDVAVGCGGLARVDDATGEIKRMYVAAEAPPTRRRPRRAAELETHRALDSATRGWCSRPGRSSPRRSRCTSRHGYEPIAPYGVYQDSPLSRCFAKDL